VLVAMQQHAEARAAVNELGLNGASVVVLCVLSSFSFYLLLAVVLLYSCLVDSPRPFKSDQGVSGIRSVGF
jgi:hypothetical protein